MRDMDGLDMAADDAERARSGPSAPAAAHAPQVGVTIGTITPGHAPATR